MYEACGVLKEFSIVGRAVPSPKCPRPAVFRMRIFAKNDVAAKSKFWYYLRRMRKVKKTHGEILGVREVPQRRPRAVKNVGIWLRISTRTRTLNMYREYRDTTINGAVNRCYSDIAGKHRVRYGAVQIVNTAIVAPAQCKKKSVKMFHDAALGFPQFHLTTKDKRTRMFSATKPNTIV